VVTSTRKNGTAQGGLGRMRTQNLKTLALRVLKPPDHVRA